MSNNCSPHVVYNDSCFTLKALKNIALKLNKYHKLPDDKKINISEYDKNSKGKLIQDIQDVLNCKKNVDFCILKKNDLFYKEINTYMKPKKPDKKWLSTLDIKKVMRQYMLKHPDFIFFGPVPLDFNIFTNELSSINLNSLRKKKKKIGVVFNLDYSYQSGSHWVSLFIDLEDNTICFFDSYGDNPPKEIINLIKKLSKQGKMFHKDFNIKINKNKHQKKDDECGIYSLYFLINRLKNKSCTELFTNVIHDKEMSKYRKKFFRYKKS